MGSYGWAFSYILFPTMCYGLLNIFSCAAYIPHIARYSTTSDVLHQFYCSIVSSCR